MTAAGKGEGRGTDGENALENSRVFGKIEKGLIPGLYGCRYLVDLMSVSSQSDLKFGPLLIRFQFPLPSQWDLILILIRSYYGWASVCKTKDPISICFRPD